MNDFTYKQKLFEIVLKCRNSKKYPWMTIQTLEEYMDIILGFISKYSEDGTWIKNNTFKTGIKLDNDKPFLYAQYNTNDNGENEIVNFYWGEDNSLKEPKDEEEIATDDVTYRLKLLNIILRCRKLEKNGEKYSWMSIQTLKEYMDTVSHFVTSERLSDAGQLGRWVDLSLKFKTGITVGRNHLCAILKGIKEDDDDDAVDLYRDSDGNVKIINFIWCNNNDIESLNAPVHATTPLQTNDINTNIPTDNWDSLIINSRRNVLGTPRELSFRDAKNDSNRSIQKMTGAMHIIIDNIDRIPDDITAPFNVDWNKKTWPNYKFNLQRFLLENNAAERNYRFVFNVLKNAINFSLINYHELFHHYNKDRDRIQYALPLFFTGSKYADCILILDKPDNRYRQSGGLNSNRNELEIKTILTPEMYYKDIRIFNPSYKGIDWLKPEE